MVFFVVVGSYLQFIIRFANELVDFKYGADGFHILLDYVVKRFNVPREHLHQVTGYNRYEVSKSEHGQIIFWITMSKKKVLLKKLKGMEPEQE